MQVAGREFSDDVLDRIRERVGLGGALTRSELARNVCDWLDWRKPDGRPKEASCRIALLKLARRGVIELPPARPMSVDRQAVRRISAAEIAWPRAEMALADLGEIWLERVDASTPESSRHWWAMVNAHHFLGGGGFSGIRYLVGSRVGYVGALGFSAASFRLEAREAWIGWDERNRQDGLSKIVCNSRFLILPSVKVPHLASHVLALALRRLPGEWNALYGVKPVLVETFIDSNRHRGTCYRAANWRCIGRTKGRGRQDRAHQAGLTAKDVWVYPLVRRWREALGGKIAEATPPADWAEEEFGGCDLGDRRLTQRLMALSRDFFAQPTASIPMACGSNANVKAAYRFLDNKRTMMEPLLQPHYRATEARMASHPIILAVQDTSSLNFTTHDETEGLGPIGTTPDGAQGLHLHCTLAVTPDSTPLGFLHVQCWARDPAEFGKKADRGKLPIEDKESFKWLESYSAVAKVKARMPGTTVVSVGDREADVAELFALARDTKDGPALLIRAKHNRRLKTEQRYLWETVEATPVAGIQVIQVPRQGSRKARKVELTVRFTPIDIRPPNGGWKKAIRAWAILAREENAPPDIKEPLEWMLLTTLPVETFEQAVEKLRWYACRWTIEVMHRILKSGCRIEERQLARADRIETCLAIDLVVAWRIHYLSKLGREAPDVPCTVAFEEDEWKALLAHATKNRFPPDVPPTLRHAIHLVAALGGFLGRKSDGEPGTQTLWLGLARLKDLTAMWRLMTHAANSPEPSTDYG